MSRIAVEEDSCIEVGSREIFCKSIDESSTDQTASPSPLRLTVPSRRSLEPMLILGEAEKRLTLGAELSMTVTVVALVADREPLASVTVTVTTETEGVRDPARRVRKGCVRRVPTMSTPQEEEEEEEEEEVWLLELGAGLICTHDHSKLRPAARPVTPKRSSS